MVYSMERSSAPRRHNRYLIYRLIGRRVVFPNPAKRARIPVSGVVEDVCRNIFENKVEVVMQGGRVFQFPEPAAMVDGGAGAVVFVYGDVGRKEQDDEEMFDEMRAGRMGENVDEVLKRTEAKETREMRFVPEEATA